MVFPKIPLGFRQAAREGIYLGETMNEADAKTCVIYCRVSSKEQVEGTSLETQERLCREYAERQGWQVSQLFIEMGESAKTADRTEFTKAIAYCATKKNRVDYFVVYKLDRFSRRTEDHLTIRAVLHKVGTELRSVTEPINESPTGKLMETVIAGFAEFDNNVRTERTKGGMVARVHEGIWQWHPPLGYYKPQRGKKTNIVPDPVTAPIIRAGFEEYAKGGRTFTAMAAFLTSRGLLTRRGKPIHPQEVQKLLRNQVYCGVIKAFGGEWQGAFEPIVSRSLFLACQPDSIVQSAWVVPRSTENPNYPLRKITICAECGKKLSGSASRGRHGKRYPYYHHSNHDCSRIKSIPKDKLEQTFAAHLADLNPDPRYLKLFRAVVLDIWKSNYKKFDDENAAARRKIEKLEQARQKVFDLHRQGTYSDEEFAEQKKFVIRQLDEQYQLLDERRADEFDMEAALDYTLEYITNATKVWVGFASNYPARIRFQKLIFREKLPFDGENFGTTVLSPIYQLKETSLSEKSLLVVPRGIEPLFTP